MGEEEKKWEGKHGSTEEKLERVVREILDVFIRKKISIFKRDDGHTRKKKGVLI